MMKNLNEAADFSINRSPQANKTPRCQEYAWKHKSSQYSEEAIYRTCCMDGIFDFDDKKEFFLKNEGRNLVFFKKAQESCGNNSNECIKKYLKDNGIDYRCDK